MINITKLDSIGEFTGTRTLPGNDHDHIVAPILADIRREGDHALLRYARQFDGLTDGSLRISEEELEQAGAALSLLNANFPRTAGKSLAQVDSSDGSFAR